MIDNFSILTAFAAIAPIIFFIVILRTLKKYTRNSSFRIRPAADLSVIVLMVSSYFLVRAIWEIDVGWWMVLATLAVAAVVTIIHWKAREDVRIVEVFKHTWRFHFLLYAAFYIFLLLTGLLIII